MGSDRRAIRPRPHGDDPPLSFAQQRMWLLDQIEVTPWAYNVVIARRLRGAIDVDVLQRALDELLVRHAVLRTTYPVVDGAPVQRIGRPGRFPLTSVDLRARPEQDAELRRRAGTEVRRSFDLEHGPVIRGLHVRLGSDDHAIVLTMHHIATDAWSEAVLLRELGVLYAAFTAGEPSPLAPLPLDYADVTLWQRERMTGDHLGAQLAYWREQLAELPPSLELAADHARPSERSGRGGTIPIEVSQELTTALRAVTRTGRATMFMTLLAAYQALLARYSGQDDVAVGTAIASRSQVEMEGIVGFFANTLVLRTDLSGDPTFLELIARVREVALGAYRHQDLPFERLVKELRPERTLRYTPLFQHMFVFQNAPAAELVLGGVHAEILLLDQQSAMFDLTLTLSESDDRLVGTLEYSTDLFEHATAVRIATDFQRLLACVADAPDAPVGAVDLLSEADRDRQLAEWNDTATDFPIQAIHEIFEHVAADHPDAIAVSEHGASVTYRDLDRRADEIAGRLRRLGVGREARVGICLPRSTDAIVAMLGTLKANGAYVPLDPEYPRIRLDFMIEDARIDVVITTSSLRDRLVGVPANVVCMDELEDVLEQPRGRRLTGRAGPESLAAILYTSGSTGVPKGVMIEHRAVVALLFGVDYIDFERVHALLHLAPLSFDASTFEIWGALLHGARCVVCSGERFDMDRLADTLSGGVDTAWMTSSLFNVVIDTDWRILRGLRQLVIGGEALSVDHVATARDRLPDLRIVNGYGPTEATTFALCHEIASVETGAERIPIGRPIANTRIHVLDDRQRPVSIGLPGELYIGGPGVARGYVGRPELTAERFVADPLDPGARMFRTGDLVRHRSDGEVEFLGRLDDQVKIRGFRVEPGEVEAVLAGLDAVAACAVVSRATAGHVSQLVAYVVARDAGEFSLPVVRAELQARLPEYLVPAVFVRVDSLPLTANGKVDRRALTELGPSAGSEGSYVAPVTETEKSLADLWAQILGVDRVGIDDDFFSVGGDSLLAAALITRTKRNLGKSIPLSVLFRRPTIRAVADALDTQDSEESPVVALRTEGSRPPLFLAHGVSGQLLRYVPLVHLLDPAQPVYGLRLTADLARAHRVRIPELAQHYVDGMVEVCPEGPYLLAGFSFGGILMCEIAHQLEVRGSDVAFLGLLDTEPRQSPSPTRAQREVRQIRSLVHGSDSVLSYLNRRARNLVVKARRAPWILDEWLHRRAGRQLQKPWDDLEQVEALRVEPVQRSFRRALSSYASPPTRCAVTYLRAGMSTAPESAVRGPDLVEGSDRRYFIDGPGVSHETLMKPPHIRYLAQALNDCLDQALIMQAESTVS